MTNVVNFISVGGHPHILNMQTRPPPIVSRLLLQPKIALLGTYFSLGKGSIFPFYNSGTQRGTRLECTTDVLCYLIEFLGPSHEKAIGDAQRSRRYDMRHEMLIQCAPKRVTLSQHFVTHIIAPLK